MTSSPESSIAPSSHPAAKDLTAGGTAGNERLTAVTGAILIALLAVIGVTIISLSRLLWVHLFVGMLLIGPVTLKLASTGYRFGRYYARDPAYRRVGPPPPPLRVIAPIVVLSTVVVFASGVALLFAGPESRHTLLPIHKLSFFVWGAFTAIHVLGHLSALPRALRGDYGRTALPGRDLPGRSGRAMSLACALTAGAVLAILVIPEFGPWVSGIR
jgi:hypothetical protein